MAEKEETTQTQLKSMKMVLNCENSVVVEEGESQDRILRHRER